MKTVKLATLILGIILVLLSVYFYASTYGSECVPPRVLTVPNTLKQGPGPKQTYHFEPYRMPSWWKTESAWQNLFKTGFENETINAIAIHDDVVWMAADQRILWLDTSTNETRSYDKFTSGDESFLPLDILVTHDGTVWALIYSVKHYYLALSKYDIQTDAFKIINDNQDILQKHTGQEIPVFVDSQVLAETEDGQIIMPFQGNIISYDPRFNIAEYLLPRDFPYSEDHVVFPITAFLTFQNKVWFTIAHDNDLRSVDLLTRELKNYGHPPTVIDEQQWEYYMKDDYRPIGVDGLGRIWMGYFARLTPMPDRQYFWEQISLPREFVATNDPDIRYLWASLASIYSSTNGDLWFESSVGLVRFNATRNQWCRSTNSISSLEYKIVEDSYGNLWMAINSNKYNGVYKYQLQP